MENKLKLSNAKSTGRHLFGDAEATLMLAREIGAKKVHAYRLRADEMTQAPGHWRVAFADCRQYSTGSTARPKTSFRKRPATSISATGTSQGDEKRSRGK